MPLDRSCGACAGSTGGADGAEDHVAVGVLGDVGGGAGLQPSADERLFVEGRQQHDGHVRAVACERGDDVDAVQAGHPDVDQCDVGSVPANERQRARAVSGLGDDGRSGRLERSHDALAIERVIVDHDHTHGRDGSTRCRLGGFGCGGHSELLVGGLSVTMRVVVSAACGDRSLG